MATEVKAAAPSAESGPRGDSAGRPMLEEDLLRFAWDADPQISPDGARVAFTRVWVDAEADEYRTQIWFAERGRPARPLTAGRLDSQPSWSPDGSRLAFARKSESGKPGQIFVMPTDGGEAVPLTALEGGASAPAWSPDGERIAFASPHHPGLDVPQKPKPKHEPGRVVTRPVFRENDRGFIDEQRRDHVWVIERTGGAPRQITHGRFTESGPRWSRDGRWILFLSDRRDEPWFGPEESKLWAIAPDRSTPTDGEELQLVVDVPGGTVAWREAADGDIAVIATQYEGPRSYEQPRLFLARGEWPRGVERLAPGYDFPFAEAINSDQHPPRGGGECPLAVGPGGAVVTRVGKHGSSVLVAVRGDRVTELTEAGHEIVAGTASDDGSVWALTVATLRSPGDLVQFEVSARHLELLDRPNPWLDEVALGEVEEFWYPSFDGTRIQAWLMRPSNGTPGRALPLLLEIHGGPHTAYGHAFFHEFQVLVSAGYAVLFTNPRGSTTYGQEFGNVIQYRFPGDDARDLLAGVDAAIARGGIDAERLGVTGGSGGGLLTNWLVVETDRFRAAVTQRCVSDWAGFYYSADFTMFTPFWFKKPPFEDPDEYREHSPVTFASKISTPLMVIHSEEDWRTPIGQGEAMFRALSSSGCRR